MIKSQKDFWTGVLYLGFGAVAFWVGRGYSMGQASRMGPGYFPTVLSMLLMVLGALALLRGLRKQGAPFGRFAWKPLLIVFSSTVAFGWLLPRAGLVVALAALIFGSATASNRFRFEWRAACLAAGVIAFCALVFVKGLGVPMPLLGSWFRI